MIKVCKQKAIKRWTFIGKVFLYAWQVSCFISIIFICLYFTNVLEPNDIVILHVFNALFSGIFGIVIFGIDDNFISLIKSKQKLFGWDDTC